MEIVTDVAQATAIPWELLRDPKTHTPLALRSPAFVRVHSQPVQRPRLPQTGGDMIRILLVICRPNGSEDVPFRSVASRLIKILGSRRDGLQLAVLRPPTFGQLSHVLRQAKAAGKPYHVVHFDGHGVYHDSSQLTVSSNPLVFADRRPGMHGYLEFENEASEDNAEFVNGSDLGRLLVETDVPVLVLNACRSAHAEAQEDPAQADDASDSTNDDLHNQVRAFGSFAQEVIDAGVVGVVAMRYNVYVVTAAQFVADLYASLIQGQTLGEAVTLGRKQLAAKPQREIAYKHVDLQDWLVPVVYEAAPITLFSSPLNTPKLTITLHANNALPNLHGLAAQLPKAPDAGFFGRDETLLALERVFDRQVIVLLHAFAGSGKTSTAAEFGRWYALTGGVQSPVLFTSFERYLPLAGVLENIGQTFRKKLEADGIHWNTLDNAQRRQVALQVLAQIPVLWIWDNVEPVSGFSDGETQRWSSKEQWELVDFLRDARDTKVKLLLTSRRDEREWLGGLAARVQVSPMPMQERVQLAQQIAEKYGHRLTDVEDWRPLLRYTQGNPQTITVLVGQALRDGLRTKHQIEEFVEKLRKGEAEIEDDEKEGRSKSLSASLSYGFTHAFSDSERQQLALLYLFQGFVNITNLRVMGDSDADWCVPAVKGLTREQGITLLNKAAEVGLLTALGHGYYDIHPVLPWYFKKLFEQYYSSSNNADFQSTVPDVNLVVRAFVESISSSGEYYHCQYNMGSRDLVEVLAKEESNLLHARYLSCIHSWRHRICNIMHGLHVLYDHSGRRAEWKRLVDEIVPYFTNISTDEPLLGQEQQWNFVTNFRVQIALEERQWIEAEKLQRMSVKWNRQVVDNGVAGTNILNSSEREALKSLASSLDLLGVILRDQGRNGCIEYHEEAIMLSQQINEQQQEAIATFNLGLAYVEISDLRDLKKAESCYRRSLELLNQNDNLGKGNCLLQLGVVLRNRALKEESFGAAITLLNAALHACGQALQLFPTDATHWLAKTHRAIGTIYQVGRRFSQSLFHYLKAVCYEEATGDFYSAARNLYNVAVMLAYDNGHYDDALLYAEAALQKFQMCGYQDTDMIQNTQELLKEIRQLEA